MASDKLAFLVGVDVGDGSSEMPIAVQSPSLSRAPDADRG